jgi:hypothetical protein
MSEMQTTRSPPLVICVPPPAASFLDPWMAGWAVLVVINGLAFGLMWGRIVGAALAAFVLCILVAAVWFSVRKSARYNRRRAEFLRRHPCWRADPVAVVLQRQWRFASIPPRLKRVESALKREQIDTSARPVIVCVGAIDIPAAADFRFEPEILRIAESPMRPPLLPMLLALVVIAAVVWLNAVGVIDLPNPDYFMWGGFVAAGILMLFWEYFVQPGYLRVAPGVVQTLMYRSPRSKPVIRSYPIDAGTLVVARQRVSNLELTLIRGDQRQTVGLGRFDATGGHWERIGQALVSTAPTPPLSDEELVG